MQNSQTCNKCKTNVVSYTNVSSAKINLDSIIDDITIRHAKTLKMLAK